ncbi:hypothetical protein TPAU25S_04178 [Tsukamurella paurometabola]|uniref:IrrE N-terminal-like domain-containing protein n=1 Tax=Tsukamurella paurometabola (strain ATCC 8368 / DSM 20162 / CCUG 35730 / CIP 100753 / JCM 10117 / KCTC 9821 / NBRC 16120 / NCIMB 702349 / NCTC 13040) TaxID=521096 RepID=D5UZ01_TSUPD|nr:hypothetical protein [Tsukamurella paurometabola]ADG80848.1 hypothetical protein Tpau_4282 [Tsukamurella paurometabola DSM 20162]SUQ39206.1 Uncharacterised protein [Tsukamurella paurometabola]
MAGPQTAWDAIRARIPLTPPWSIDELLAWVAEDTGRVVDLQPWAESANVDRARTHCGVVAGYADRWVIRFDGRRSRTSRLQTIGHEIGHILAGHGAGEGRSLIDASTAQLTYGLNLDGLRYVLGRSSYSDAAEAEAEFIGSKLASYTVGDLGHAGAHGRLRTTFQ